MGGVMSESRVNLSFIVAVMSKFWWLVLLGLLAGAAGCLGYAAMQTPLYRSTASLHFSLDQGSSAVDLNQGSAYTQGQMLSFAQLAQGSRVLDPVIDELDLGVSPRQLERRLEISVPQETVTMHITATDVSPQGAAELATAVSESLIDEVQNVAPRNPDGDPTITAVVYDDAVPPVYQSSPDKTKATIVGGMAGGAIAVAAAFLIALLDTRIRSEEALARASDHPVLGKIENSPLLAGRGIAILKQPLSHAAEDTLRIRSALRYATVTSQVKVLLVTACSPGEGKSTISANLAAALGANKDSVLLVDGDLRRPRVHEFVGIDGAVGLTGVLLEELDVSTAVHNIQGTTIDVLPAGKIPPNPAEMLTSQRMADLIGTVTAHYEYVVIDTPPILSVADVNLLTPLADGVVVTVDARHTRHAQLVKSLKALEVGGARILGTVLNRARPDRSRAVYYAEE